MPEDKMVQELRENIATLRRELALMESGQLKVDREGADATPRRIESYRLIIRNLEQLGRSFEDANPNDPRS